MSASIVACGNTESDVSESVGTENQNVDNSTVVSTMPEDDIVVEDTETVQEPELTDEELERIYSYGILNEEMFCNLEQAVTGKDCYDLALAYVGNYGEDAITKFQHYMPTVPEDVEIDMSDVLAMVYLAAFSSDEAWLYYSEHDVKIDNYRGSQAFCYNSEHNGFNMGSGLYDDVYVFEEKLRKNYWGLEGCSTAFTMLRRSPASGKAVYEIDENVNLVDITCSRGELVRMFGRLYEGNMPFVREATELDAKILADADARRESILNSKTEVTYTGTAYYVSNEGNDKNDGLTPETAWASIEKVSNADLQPGDAVFFNRGDTFRGYLWAREGVTYSAYGEGSKPILTTCPENLSGSDKWVLYYEGEDGRKIWKYHDMTQPYGNMIFNDGESYASKRYPFYSEGEMYLEMSDELVLFDVTVHLNNHEFLTTGDCERDFDRVVVHPKTGDLYLRMDEGNPGELYESIECSTIENNVWTENNTVYDNLSIRFGQCGFIYGKENVTVQNCELCYQGGFYFNPFGESPSDCGTGAGDALTIGGWNNKAINNYIHDVYDDGISIEYLTGNPAYSDCIIDGNLIENCNGGILLVNWFDTPEEGYYMKDIQITNNYVLRCGDVWSHESHSHGYATTSAFTNCAAYGNKMKNITVSNNVFYLSKGELIAFPVRGEYQNEIIYSGNTYVQYKNAYIGVNYDEDLGYAILYGSTENEKFVSEQLGDAEAIVE